jgi:phosphomannomutase / phosphoglucomutase
MREAVRTQPHIFRQYDIRGIVGEDLDADVAEQVGRAYGTLLREATGKNDPTVVVGQDNRPSSPEMAAGLMRGLRDAGLVVTDIGTAPTPVVYWAEKVLEADGGIQITGSHNPPEWNGIKMTVQGNSIHGDTILGLRSRIESGQLASGTGTLGTRAVLDDYVRDVAGRFELERPVRVAVDCGNGSGSLVAVQLLEAIGAEVIPLFCESDGTFPNHHPDPTVDANLVDLIRAVRSGGAECGIAFDGDADRIGVVDENGHVIRGDLLLLVFALDILERDGKGQKFVFDVKCSQALPEVIEKHGGVPIMWMTGHSLIKEKMREQEAPLAGELSGHICFADRYYGFDDAPYAACRLAELLSRSGSRLSSMVSEFPAYVSTPELRVEVEEARKFDIVRAAQEHFRKSHEVIDVDGARILFGDGWGLLRASNTQPVLVARYEALTEERLREIQGEVEGWLRSQGVDPEAGHGH